jgi:hypothetical protein
LLNFTSQNNPIASQIAATQDAPQVPVDVRPSPQLRKRSSHVQTASRTNSRPAVRGRLGFFFNHTATTEIYTKAANMRSMLPVGCVRRASTQRERYVVVKRALAFR